MTGTTLLKNDAVPVGWYFVLLDGVEIGWVVQSDGRNWRAYVKNCGDYPGEAGLVDTCPSRKKAVEAVEAVEGYHAAVAPSASDGEDA